LLCLRFLDGYLFIRAFILVDAVTKEQTTNRSRMLDLDAGLSFVIKVRN